MKRDLSSVKPDMRQMKWKAYGMKTDVQGIKQEPQKRQGCSPKLP
ncbi:hypothetical protein CLV24_1366 [Pontibacter ummariensis]|uniref:Uncharacterized protein n=1 Tax=Pontibacter ummariensis TaxID=1610492 RepID=A0A239L5C0_9BACT|nr:hypothetical protein CLV24_1366 [Pontibacter ummariensis]SNT25510.1 hypothetical protein SAMN06296052_1366 [Pontibacter ummariensis]